MTKPNKYKSKNIEVTVDGNDFLKGPFYYDKDNSGRYDYIAEGGGCATDTEIPGWHKTPKTLKQIGDLRIETIGKRTHYDDWPPKRELYPEEIIEELADARVYVPVVVGMGWFMRWFTSLVLDLLGKLYIWLYPHAVSAVVDKCYQSEVKKPQPKIDILWKAYRRIGYSHARACADSIECCDLGRNKMGMCLTSTHCSSCFASKYLGLKTIKTWKELEKYVKEN